MLSHIKVLDLSTTLPGPYCTMILAQFGADVIKLEQPGLGDSLRQMYPWIYENINANKRSMALDLKHDADRRTAHELVKRMDVVIEGFRPSVVQRLGMDYETVKKINPNIVYCSISGFGQTGPCRDIPGHDLNFMGMAGALTMTGRVEEDPESGHVQKIPFSDFGAGVFAASAILACLNGPERKPVHIDVSMADLIFSWMGLKAGHFFQRNIPPETEALGEAHYGIFKTKDHQYVAMGVIEDHFWVKLCDYFGWQDLLNDGKYDTYAKRNESRPVILPRLREAVSVRERDMLVQDLLAAGIPCTPLKNLQELPEDPHILQRELLIARDDRSGYDISFPLKLTDYKLCPRGKAPAIGQHNEEILQQFGLNKD